MKCEDLQFNLAVYADDTLNEEERAVVEAHLSKCPLCRQKLADFQELRNSLRVFARPEMPSQVLNSLRSSVAAELRAASPKSKSVLSNDFKEWLQMRVMPYGIGAFASLILGFTLLWSLLSAAQIEPNNQAQYDSFSKSTVLLADANPKKNNQESFDLTPSEYAQSRFAISAESPSVNPQGSLVELTKSLMRGDLKHEEEVVVVADVYGNGLAQITEVVEPSNNQYAVYELEKALKSDSDYAPFVPANLDRRSDSVRVVFKIQSVDVKTNLKPIQQ